MRASKCFKLDGFRAFSLTPKQGHMAPNLKKALRLS